MPLQHAMTTRDVSVETLVKEKKTANMTSLKSPMLIPNLILNPILNLILNPILSQILNQILNLNLIEVRTRGLPIKTWRKSLIIHTSPCPRSQIQSFRWTRRCSFSPRVSIHYTKLFRLRAGCELTKSDYIIYSNDSLLPSLKPSIITLEKTFKLKEQ